MHLLRMCEEHTENYKHLHFRLFAHQTSKIDIVISNCQFSQSLLGMADVPLLPSVVS